MFDVVVFARDTSTRTLAQRLLTETWNYQLLADLAGTECGIEQSLHWFHVAVGSPAAETFQRTEQPMRETRYGSHGLRYLGLNQRAAIAAEIDPQHGFRSVDHQ
jgi:hypothetical protein